MQGCDCVHYGSELSTRPPCPVRGTKDVLNSTELWTNQLQTSGQAGMNTIDWINRQHWWTNWKNIQNILFPNFITILRRKAGTGEYFTFSRMTGTGLTGAAPCMFIGECISNNLLGIVFAVLCNDLLRCYFAWTFSYTDKIVLSDITCF